MGRDVEGVWKLSSVSPSVGAADPGRLARRREDDLVRGIVTFRRVDRPGC